MFAVGVTDTVAVSVALVLLAAEKEDIFPLPVVARAMLLLLFVQVYVVPVTLLLKTTAAVGAPLHTAWLVGIAAIGVGSTVIVKCVTVPAQPLAVGVIVTVAVSIPFVVLVAVKEPMLPVPVDASAMLALLLDQV